LIKKQGCIEIEGEAGPTCVEAVLADKRSLHASEPTKLSERVWPLHIDRVTTAACLREGEAAASREQ